MKKRFTEAQIIGFLKEADGGLPVKDLCRRHGFSEASYYLWRSKFGGMSVPDVKRLKELETENQRLNGLSPAETFVVLAHENAHCLPHPAGDRPASRDTRELEAECVLAYIAIRECLLGSSRLIGRLLKLYLLVQNFF